MAISLSAGKKIILMICECSTVAVCDLPKVEMRVRFPSLALKFCLVASLAHHRHSGTPPKAVGGSVKIEISQSSSVAEQSLRKR